MAVQQPHFSTDNTRFSSLSEDHQIIEVYDSNLSLELNHLYSYLRHFLLIAIDTEFPGCLRTTPRFTSKDDKWFQDLKYNLENTKIIQLGITLCNREGHIGQTWEFNFSGFDERTDKGNRNSIDFLKRNGLDLQKINSLGVDPDDFFMKFANVLKLVRGEFIWITFHGLYDVGYLLKGLNKNVVPDTSINFIKIAGYYLGCVYDVKFIAGHYDGSLDSKTGLAKLGKDLKIERVGAGHHAGSDSLLTACVFDKIKQEGYADVRSPLFEGMLYGMKHRITMPRVLVCPRCFSVSTPQSLVCPFCFSALTPQNIVCFPYLSGRTYNM